MNIETGLSIGKTPILLTGKMQIPDLKEHESIGLYEDVTLDEKGRISIITFYRNYDFDTRTPSIPLVRERYSFTEDALGFVKLRNKKIDYYDELQNIVYTNETIQDKPYNFMTAKAEGERRRKNLIDKATLSLINSVGLANAISFSSSLASQINSYVFGSDTASLKNSITNAVQAFMTQEIKDSVLEILNNA